MATNDTSQLSAQEYAAQREADRRQRNIIIIVSTGLLLFFVLIGLGVAYLFLPNTDAGFVSRLRDVFLILMALESLFIGVALVILMVQIASLINLLQNEVRPILQATNETVNTLRGTAEFLGENVVQPVIKLNGYMAGLQRVLELMGLKRN